MSFRPMPLLTVLSLISLVILVMLGNWQYGRYSEKLDRPPIEAELELSERLVIEIDQDDEGYAQQVYGFANSEPIWRRYIAGRLAGSNEPVLAMVEATGGATPIQVKSVDLPETVTFDGILAQKAAGSRSFAGKDKPDENIWYTLDPAALASAFGLEGVPRVAEPVIMTVRDSADLNRARQTANPYAFAKPIDPLPPERHFGYALTWWGMALGLIGVYVALHRSRGRLKF